MSAVPFLERFREVEKSQAANLARMCGTPGEIEAKTAEYIATNQASDFPQEVKDALISHSRKIAEIATWYAWNPADLALALA